MRPLHRLNPVRLSYIREKLLQHGLAKASSRQAFKGLSILDVGCGAGLLAEPMARLGADVTGLDASKEAIAEAKRHAKVSGLDIDYRNGTAEDLAEGKTRYDVVTALEIVEHVADLDTFIAALAKLVKPGGVLILSTVNRTPESFLLGIVAAEHILRWVPRGTHNWRQFVRPSELVQRLEKEKMETADLTGIVFHPLKNDFALDTRRLGINYMVMAVK